MLGTTLLVDPGGVAPGLSGTLAMLPAWPSIKHAVRLDERSAGSSTGIKASKDKSRMLLDYWIVVGCATLLEQVLGSEAISAVMPLWWLIKGMSAVWFLVSLSGAPVVSAARSSRTLVSKSSTRRTARVSAHGAKPGALVSRSAAF